MADFYQDPKSSLAFLLNPNTPLSETDSIAAAAAIGGGMPGSMFAQNNQLRLRDSERINRLQIGQNLLQPYLNREFQSQQQTQQIAAQAAQQAITESGAMSRLNAEQAGALQRALISGNQQAAHDLLQESGANSRQAALLSSNLQEATMRNQAGILQSLLGYAGAQGKAGAGGRGGGMVGGGGGDWSSPSALLNDYGSGNSITGYRPPQSVTNAAARAGAGGGALGAGLSGKLGSTLDSILRQYGLN